MRLVGGLAFSSSKRVAGTHDFKELPVHHNFRRLKKRDPVPAVKNF